MNLIFNLIIIIADECMLFIINILVARYAGEELFGDFSVATNALLLIATIITFGIDLIIAYFVPKFYFQKKYNKIARLTISVKNFLKPIYHYLLIGGLILSLAIILLAYKIHDITLFDVSHPLFLFLWGAIAISLFAIFFQFFCATNYIRTAIVLSLLQTLFYFILSLLIYFYLYPRIFNDNPHYFTHVMLIGFIGSYILTVLLSVGIERKITLHQFRPKRNINHSNYLQWKEKIYGYTVQSLKGYIFAAIPLLIMELLAPNEQSVGLFSAVLSIIFSALIVITPIGILIGPKISSAFARNRQFLKETVIKYVLILFVISFIVALIIATFSSKILLFYKSDFIRALPYTYFCLINIILYATSIPLSQMMQYSSRGSTIGAKLTISLFLLQSLASFILIPLYGLAGAVICFIGITIIYDIALVILSIKIYHSESFGEIC